MCSRSGPPSASKTARALDSAPSTSRAAQGDLGELVDLAALASAAATSAIAVARCNADSRCSACRRASVTSTIGAEQPYRFAVRVGHHPAPGDHPAHAPVPRAGPATRRVLAAVRRWRRPSTCCDRGVVIGVDVLGEHPLDGSSTGPSRPNSAAQRSSQSTVPVVQVGLPDTDRAGLQGHLQPGERGADGRARGGELQLGDHGRRELLQQLGVVGGPRARHRVVDGEDTDDVPGRRDQRGTRGRRATCPEVTAGRSATRSSARAAGRSSGAAVRTTIADSAPVSSAGPPMTPGGRPKPPTTTVVVGEQGDLGVAGAQQPGGQAGEPVERRRPGTSSEQPAGGGDAVRVAQRVGAPGAGAGPARTRILPRPPADVRRRRTAGSCCHARRGRPGRRRRRVARGPPAGERRPGRSSGRCRCDREETTMLARPACGLPSAAGRPRGPHGGVPADRRPGVGRHRRLRGARPVPGHRHPDVWFAAAAEAGLGAELEALAIHKRARRAAGPAAQHLPHRQRQPAPARQRAGRRGVRGAGPPAPGRRRADRAHPRRRPGRAAPPDRRPARPRRPHRPRRRRLAATPACSSSPCCARSWSSSTARW